MWFLSLNIIWLLLIIQVNSDGQQLCPTLPDQKDLKFNQIYNARAFFHQGNTSLNPQCATIQLLDMTVEIRIAGEPIKRKRLGQFQNELYLAFVHKSWMMFFQCIYSEEKGPKTNIIIGSSLERVSCKATEEYVDYFAQIYNEFDLDVKFKYLEKDCDYVNHNSSKRGLPIAMTNKPDSTLITWGFIVVLLLLWICITCI